MEWIWFKTLGSLVLILGLIVGTMWLLKRFMTFGKPAAAGGIAMEIAGVLHLGPRRSVYAVKAGSQVILLGVAEHAITFLTQLPESSTDGAGAGSAQPIGAAAPFFGLLAQQFTRHARPEHREPVVAPESILLSEVPVKKTKSSAAPRKKVIKPL
jgi:flagellar biosynthetic protein FliO